MKPTDEIYNTMCLKSHQLQSLKRNVGNYDQYDVVLNLNMGIKLLAIQLLRNVVTEETIWIPRQEQIQQILLSQNIPIDKLIESFDDWVFSIIGLDAYNIKTERYLTFEMLWIMYYMEKIHGYYWCWSCNMWRLLKYKSIAQDNPLSDQTTTSQSLN